MILTFAISALDMHYWSFQFKLGLVLLFLSVNIATISTALAQADGVSFVNDVRPILRANCFGCHQPASAAGDYVMTDFASMLGGTDPESAAIAPGDPAASYLLELITPDDNGQAEMPDGKPPLKDEDVELIRRWIEEGAINDEVESRAVFSRDNPPVYKKLPAITALDYSHDGTVLAISGYHEVLLLDTTSKRIRHRLIGLSPRIEKIRFSPNGKRLAVSGGTPGLNGEIQVWNVADGELLLSKTVSHDTAFGINWSPDGNLLSFGLTDTTLRAIDSETGDQVLFQGAHEDWIRDTVFSVDGSRLVSAGRDTTCKLTNVATERFVDNITSITPAILKGGISSVARHPERDEVVVGCADGIPKIYRLDRQTKRVIGDDANLIRRLPSMNGRIESVDVSGDGLQIAAGSSLDGRGAVSIYSYEFDTSLPEQIKAIMRKVVSSRTGDERKKIEAYVTKDVRQISIANLEAGIYSVAFHPNNKTVAAGGNDGLVRLIDTETGNIKDEFAPIEIEPANDDQHLASQWLLPAIERQPNSQNIDQPARLRIYPEHIELNSKTSYTQLVVTAELETGETHDVSSNARFEFDDQLIQVDQTGFVQLANPNRDLSCELKLGVEFGGLQIEVPVSLDVDSDWKPDFVTDVNPVFSRLGCNAGTCHGSQSGKNGFKLSLRGYDPVYDIRSLTRDLASRRINPVSPSESLILQKPSMKVPHEGGQLITKNDKYRQILSAWIENGAMLNDQAPKVVSIQIAPTNPVLQSAGQSQQVRVSAKLSDGSVRDVTRESFVVSSDQEVAEVRDTRLTAIRRGETAVVARYEGAFATTIVTVMGERQGFVWSEPEVFGKIDELVAKKWHRMKIAPAQLCSDSDFIRRVHLDLTGLPPSADQVRAFLKDDRDAISKRAQLVDHLIDSSDFTEYWTNKWADLLQVNRKFLGVEGSTLFRDWIRKQVHSNIGYDQFVKYIITASGSNRENPAASYYKVLRTPEDTMENTTHLFLGTRFNCNKCHDHPFERWTQDQYYQTAAWFSRFKLERDPASGEKRIGGSAVESANPLYEKIVDAGDGEMQHKRTGKTVEPQFPFECDYDIHDAATRREQFAAWLTSRDNPYFATSYVNRLWGYLMGTGLIEPLDDIRASNPPTNPELMAYLTDEFLTHDFDMRHMIRLICNSRVYQLSIKSNEFNQDDFVNYSHAIPRRLPAEVLFDAIHFVTGSQSKIPGVEPGTRAAMLSDSGVKLPSGFLSTLGRPARESACECERSDDLQLGSVLALVSGPDVAQAISDPENAISKLVTEVPDNSQLVQELYMRILNRPATDSEIETALQAFELIERDHWNLSGQRDERERLVTELLPDREAKRKESIELTSSELQDAISKFEPDLDEKERAHQEQLANAEKALNDYRGEESKMFEKWQKKQLQDIQWHPLQVSAFSTNASKSWKIESDRSISLAKSKPGKDLYAVEGKVDLQGITGIRLEVLADERLPARGPGLAGNGNFVLTEFEMEIAHPDQPDEWKKVDFERARSYFDQAGYPIEHAFDGQLENNQGWATMGHIGKTNWACFVTKVPVGYSGGSLVRFKLHQNFDNQHQIGRFRLSLTSYPHRLGLSLPEELAALIVNPLDSLDDNKQEIIRQSFERDDKKLIELQQTVAEARKPPDIHPEVFRLRDKLERVSQPLQPDARLKQLNRDFEHSTAQLENHRLTAAQDLAWALINSPSFLFNR